MVVPSFAFCVAFVVSISSFAFCVAFVIFSFASFVAFVTDSSSDIVVVVVFVIVGGEGGGGLFPGNCMDLRIRVRSVRRGGGGGLFSFILALSLAGDVFLMDTVHFFVLPLSSTIRTTWFLPLLSACALITAVFNFVMCCCPSRCAFDNCTVCNRSFHPAPDSLHIISLQRSSHPLSSPI